jgi:hypothetical protein
VSDATDLDGLVSVDDAHATWPNCTSVVQPPVLAHA